MTANGSRGRDKPAPPILGDGFNGPMTDALLPPGSTAVRRDVFDGRLWTAAPFRVLSADESTATVALWPGVVTLAATEFIESVRTGDDAIRSQALAAIASGAYQLGEWAWRWNGVVTELVPGRWFTVGRMYGPDGAFRFWYVNFERPPTWRGDGWDTFDLLVDLVVKPDGSRRWKDEDEYAQGRRLGLITDAEHAAVRAAREEAVALVETRSGLFSDDATAAWLPDPAWPLPVLPTTPHAIFRLL